MTQEDNDEIKQFYDAYCCYSVQTPAIEQAARLPANRLDWSEMKMPDSFKTPPDFSFGGEGTRRQTGQPRSERAPGD